MTVRGKKANIAFKYRILPDSRQKELFSKTFGCCRKIWNLMKADRDKAYQENRKTIYPTPAQYKTEYPFLKEVDSLALANVQLNQNKAYREFFKACKEKRICAAFQNTSLSRSQDVPTLRTIRMVRFILVMALFIFLRLEM